MRVRFWGIRGSIPVALTAEQIESILRDAVRFQRLTRGHCPLHLSAACDGLDIEL